MTHPKICNPKHSDCEDKDSAHYFMFHMTQEDWEERQAWSHIKRDGEFISKVSQYLFNRINKWPSLNL